MNMQIFSCHKLDLWTYFFLMYYSVFVLYQFILFYPLIHLWHAQWSLICFLRLRNLKIIFPGFSFVFCFHHFKQQTTHIFTLIDWKTKKPYPRTQHSALFNSSTDHPLLDIVRVGALVLMQRVRLLRFIWVWSSGTSALSETAVDGVKVHVRVAIVRPLIKDKRVQRHPLRFDKLDVWVEI